jgi:hypothetical protein
MQKYRTNTFKDCRGYEAWKFSSHQKSSINKGLKVASFETAYNWMMDNEDRARACAIVPDDPRGARAISGINSVAYPSEYAAIAALPQSQRQPAVQNFYQVHFWNQWYARLTFDDVSKRVFDAAVNMGPGTAVKLLQQASGSAVDGAWGPDTVALVNSIDSATMVSKFQAARLAHYQAIVANNPSLAQYLGTAEKPGSWWIRATQ